MSNLSDNINDDLKTTNPKAYHWREMYLRQVDLYNTMLATNEKLITEKEKLIAEKDKLLTEKNELIAILRQKSE